MSIDLYGLNLSAPCRSVLMAAKALGVKVKFIPTNIMAGENKTPEFLKMNLQHSIPTIDDGGFYLNESRAALQYLANKYGKDSNLYPSDPKARAKVDMKLNFDMGTLYSKFGEAYYPAIFGKTSLNPENLEKFEEALGFLEEYIKKEKYIAGDHITIADFAIASTLATIEAAGHDLSKFSKTLEYFAKLKKEIVDYEELNQKGADEFGGWVKSAIVR